MKMTFGQAIGLSAIRVYKRIISPWLLPKIIGRHRAFELLFGGEPFPAARAEALGLINRVVPADRVLEEARGLAQKMAAKAPSVVRFGRNAFHRANALDLHRSIEDVADALAAVADLPEAQEGLTAFVEKRKPSFRHR